MPIAMNPAGAGVAVEPGLRWRLGYFVRVAVQEFRLSCHSSEAILLSTSPYYGNLN